MSSFRIALVILLCTVIFELFPTATKAQNQGTPWHAIPLPLPNGFVDASTGNLHLEIPLGSIPQRNGDPIISALIYDAAYLYPVGGTSGSTGFGWRGIVGSSRSGISGLQWSSASCSSFGVNDPFGHVMTYSGFWFRDIHGTTYSLPHDQPFTRQVSCTDPVTHQPAGTQYNVSSATGTSFEGVGYTFQVSNYTSWRVYAADGSLVFSNFSDQNVVPRDPNGNTGQTSAPNIASALPAFQTVQNNTQGAECGSTSSTTTSTFIAADGTSASYTMTCTALSVSDGTNVSTIGFLTSLGLPDGTSYSFTYDTGSTGTHNGHLLSMTLPTGGVISFTYATAQIDVLRVASLTYGGGTWNLAYAHDTPTTGQTTTTVTAPPRYDVATASTVNDKTVFIISENIVPLVQTAKYYSGPSTLLKTVNYIYTNFLPTTITTTLNDTGQSSSVYLQYYNNVWRNYVTQKQETDFSGTIVRTTKTGYNLSYMKPATVNVYSGDGSGSPIATTTYLYDEYNANYCKNGVPMLGSFTGAYGHDDTNFGTGYTTRGNLTTIQRLISGTNYSTTHMCYDTLGNVTQVVDANGNPTTYDFTDNWHDTSCIPGGTITHAFPTTITDALGYRTKKSYFSCPILVQSVADENEIRAGLSKTFTYDSFGRLLFTHFPDGGQQTNSFNATVPPTATSTVAINTSLNKSVQINKDSYGRVSQTQLTTDPQGIVYADTTYDVLSHVATASNPYRSGSDLTSSAGTTSYNYDALGRKTREAYPDGSVLTTTYCGPSTLVTDPTGKWRRSLTDSLGRLIEVDEPNAPGATVASNGCRGTGEPIWITTYSYDVLGNLTGVLQNGSLSRTFTYDSLSRLLTSTNPESGTITYTYDASGNVLTKKDARNITATYTYDALNRNKSITYSNGDPTITINYDEANCLGLSVCHNIGHRTSMTDGSGSEAWSFDVVNRIHKEQRTTNGITKTATYNFDLAGNVTSVVYPTGRTVNYTFDAANRPITATDSSNGITYATGFKTSPGGTCLSNVTCYTPQGAFYALSIGQTATFNGLNLTHIYNNRLQPQQFKASSSGGNAMDISYNFVDPVSNHNAGHVYGITNNILSVRSQAFTYDQLNRITSAQTTSTFATGPAYCWGETYQYDGTTNGAWGNLTQIVATTNPGYTGCSQESGFTKTADGNNHLSGFSYDVAGNATGDGVNSYTWDAESQLKVTAGSTYLYDGVGRRVAKANTAIPPVPYKLYWYGSGGEILSETDGSGNTNNSSFNEYIFFGAKRVAMITNGGNPTYYVEDLLGTSRALTTNTGALCYDADFYPFGVERTPYTNTCTQNAYKFEGKERDAETGNDDFGARYYSNRFGRWLSADWSSVPVPVPYANLNNPQTLNLYAMVSDDPESFADLDGHCPECEQALDWGMTEIRMGSTPFEKGIGALVVIGAVVGIAATSPQVRETVANVADAYANSGAHSSSPYYGPIEPYKPIQNQSTVNGNTNPQASQQGQTTPANPNGNFTPSPKHGPEDRRNVSRGPSDGQTALNNSTQVKGTAPRRVGVDKQNGEIVVLDQTSKGEFHGHVRGWKDLTQQMRNALIKAKLTDKKGNIL